MDPYTILFHGTTQHQDRDYDVDPLTGFTYSLSARVNEECIHEITKMLAGDPFDDFHLVLDGVGSFGTARNPTPGTFDVFTFNKLPKSNDPKLKAYQTTTAILDHNEGPRVPVRSSSLPPPSPRAPGWSDWFEGWFKAVSRSVSNRMRPIENKKTYLEGILKGEGMDDNMRHAIAVWVSRHTYELLGSSPEKFRINLVGWSRGGVTAIRTANYFSEILGDRGEINVFAFDPVPGGTLSLDDARKVGRSVKSYVSLLSMHDRRESFHPIDMTGEARCRIDLGEVKKPLELVLLPMPGVHSTALHFAANKNLRPRSSLISRTLFGGDSRMVNLHGCAEVGRYLAVKFLTLKETKFKSSTPDTNNPPSNFTPAKLCEKYSEMVLNLPDYAQLDPKFTTALQSLPFGRLSSNRAVLTDQQSYMFRPASTKLFLNEHHLSAFLKTYPGTALARNITNRGGVDRREPDPFTAQLLQQNPGPLTIGHMPWRARTEANWSESLGRGVELLDKMMG